MSFWGRFKWKTYVGDATKTEIASTTTDITTAPANSIVEKDDGVRYQKNAKGAWQKISTGHSATDTFYQKDDTFTRVEIEDRFNNVLDITNTLNEGKVSYTQYDTDMADIQTAVGDILAAREVIQIKTKAYLNGGYKGGVVEQKRVQRFNSVTETGGDLGVISTITSSYRPGGTSKFTGYFFGAPTTSGGTSSANGLSVDGITYASESCYNISNGGLGFSVNGTLYDINYQTHCYGSDNTNWLKINTETNAITTIAQSTNATIGRQQLSSETFGLCKDPTSAQYQYVYETEVATSVGAAFSVTNHNAGMVKDKTMGYWIGFTNTNFKIDYTTFAHTQVTPFTIHFGESNTLGTETHGYAMGGYIDNGSQHAKVQKMDWATESGSTVLGGDLSYAQSSAGCAEA